MSIREKILAAIDKAGAPLAANEIYNACGDVETASQVVSACYCMKHDGTLVSAKVDGLTKYGRPGMKFGAGAAAVEREPKPSRKVVPLKLRKAKAAKARKAKPIKRKKAAATREASFAMSAALASRWAVTHDGAFVDLAQPGTEISGARARALVDFVRKLDAADIAA